MNAQAGSGRRPSLQSANQSATLVPINAVTNVRLRPVTEDDLPIFYEQQRDPIANAMADFPAREHAAFFAHWRGKVLSNPNGIARTILCDEVVPGPGVIAGPDVIVGPDVIAGNIVSWLHDGKREVGYWLGREFWGKGIATRALQAFLAIDTTRPLHAFVVHHNLGSLRVLQKCGFTVIGSDAEGVTLARYS